MDRLSRRPILVLVTVLGPVSPPPPLRVVRLLTPRCGAGTRLFICVTGAAADHAFGNIPMIPSRHPWLHDWGRPSLGRSEIARTAVIVVLFTLLALAANTLFGEVEAALIVMLGIAVAGASGELLASLSAAAIAFFVYNFFISEPVLSFRIATGRDLAPPQLRWE